MSDAIMPTGARKPLVPLATVPRPLRALLNEILPRFHDECLVLENARQLAVQVDGSIIGTGEPDFTKGNTLYTLRLCGKTFQLMDVPGIEGHEAQYTDLVQQAVAKAHLVFYVNGTNKKPEEGTGEKIKQYLKRGTQVYSIVNVRGKADSYEDDEDRQNLGKQGNAKGALTQTMQALEKALPPDVLLGGQCVQGLLAFSALTVDANTEKTTIHPSRSTLISSQRSYLKHFGSTQAMKDFSQVEQLAAVLRSKQETFKDDMVESNKTKVKELLQENKQVLEAARQSHISFIERLEPEFKKCREAVDSATSAFEGKSRACRRRLWTEFYNKFSSAAKAIVEDHFGDDQIIGKNIKINFEEGQRNLQQALQGKLEVYFRELQDDLSEALLRLQQDVSRLDIQIRLSKTLASESQAFETPLLEMGLGLKGWGALGLKVGSYASAGAAIGSALEPGIGTVIGAVVGAAIGGLMTLIEKLRGEEARIRKAQSQLQSKIDDIRAEAMLGLNKGDKELAHMVREEIVAKALAQVEILHHAIGKPLPIIERQIASMIHIQQRLEEMPHGTIQGI